jgi:MFS-type transporter involved in bile tolerance (Atg22 family)
MVVLTFYSTGNLNLAIGLLFLSNLSVAFSDVIVDSLMVVQSRKYPDVGSEELNAYSWTCYGIGSILGSLMAAILTQKFEPRHCFLYSCFMGFVIAVVALRLNIMIEKEGLSIESENRSFVADVRRNLREVRQAC